MSDYIGPDPVLWIDRLLVVNEGAAFESDAKVKIARALRELQDTLEVRATEPGSDTMAEDTLWRADDALLREHVAMLKDNPTMVTLLFDGAPCLIDRDYITAHAIDAIAEAELDGRKYQGIVVRREQYRYMRASNLIDFDGDRPFFLGGRVYVPGSVFAA